jgi:beta-lactam-binding protein with PASTA domain
MRIASRFVVAAAASVSLLGSCSSSTDETSHVPVPNVVGMDMRNAIDALDASGYCIGTVWRVEEGTPGVVVGQQPGPQNETVGPGYDIGLEVVNTSGLRTALSETAVPNCDPELAPAGTVNYAYFYRGSHTG